ncbi:MAG TPA: polysaccharide deacetylase family protein [Chthoniobacterales bacterium]
METVSAPNKSAWPLRLLLAFVFIAPCLGFYLVRFNLFLGLAPIFLSHMLLLYPTLVPNCQWFGPVMQSFATDKPQVWLTIDDGPSPAHTVAMLDLLDRFNARATFFVVGSRAEKYPHLLTEILSRGHEIANHTYTHSTRTFWMAGPRRIAAEIDLCAELLRVDEDHPARYFRAPVGFKNLFVNPELDRRSLALIGWSVRGFDTIRREAGQVARRIVRSVKPGAIIVLHEGQRVARDPQFNPRCLELTLDGLTERGYGCVIPRPEQLRPRAAGK